MARLPTVSYVSIVFGFISFGLTLLTWLGVYISLLKTLRSAPSAIPLTIGNIRQELIIEKKLLKGNVRKGDTWNVFADSFGMTSVPNARGKRTRGRDGRSETHIWLIRETMRQCWRDFCALEQRFLIKGCSGLADEESKGSGGEDRDESDSQIDEKVPTSGPGVDAQARTIRDVRALRRKKSRVKNMMGMTEAALSVNRTTYYRTDLGARILFWWLRDDVENLISRIQRLQIRRIERDVIESDELVKRGLLVLGDMSGENVRRDHSYRSGGGSQRYRKDSRPGSVHARSRSHDLKRGEREIYEREIRTVRPVRRSSASSPSPSPRPRSARFSSNTTRRRSEAKGWRSSSRGHDEIRPDGGWVSESTGRGASGQRYNRNFTGRGSSRRRDADVYELYSRDERSSSTR